MNNYLIPANSKKSMLIFGVFTQTDLIIAGVGLLLTIILALVLDISNIVMAIIALVPLGIAALLVMPVPNYHNVRVILGEIWEFYTTRQSFVWKGWCFLDGEDNKK